MPRALRLRAALAWIERKRSAPLELAIAVRSSSGMKTSVERVSTTSVPSSWRTQALEAQRHVQHQVLLLQAARSDRAGIVAAVAGVDHDPARAQAELAREAVGARAVGSVAAAGVGQRGGVARPRESAAARPAGPPRRRERA